MGAIAEGGVEVLQQSLIQDLGIPRDQVRQVAIRERLELERRDRLFRGGRHPLRSRGRHRHPGRRRSGHRLDDGGGGCRAAPRGPARIVVSVPVGARETCERLAVSRIRWSVSRCRSRSMRLAAGIRSSTRRATPKWSACWRSRVRRRRQGTQCRRRASRFDAQPPRSPSDTKPNSAFFCGRVPG